MPIILIEIAKGYTTDHETEIMYAVHTALQQSFQILNNDIIVRLVAHDIHRFSIPKTNPVLYAQPALCTLITIDCYAGRSLETKRALYQKIADNLAQLGIPRDHIKIVLRESPQENWGIRGGQAGCDVEVEYKIEM